MMKNAAITIRLPARTKRRLEARARQQHRSLSAQVAHDLEMIMERESALQPASGPFLGLFAGTAVPTDDDIREVRSMLWGSLASRSDGDG